MNFYYFLESQGAADLASVIESSADWGLKIGARYLAVILAISVGLFLFQKI